MTAPPIAAPRWAVAATVREPAGLVLAFAAHHLCLGAAEIWLFFDDPEDPAAARAATLPRTRVVRCDAAYWAGRRRARPQLQSVRQLANATYAYNRTSADWMLHADADEFLWCEAPLADEIGRLAPEHGWLKIRNLERVWTEETGDASIFEGAARRPVLPGDAIDLGAIYGDVLPFLRMGFAGYPVGKGLSRTGRGYRLNVHAPRTGKGVPPFRTARRVHLVHFDGLTPRHWAAKTLRYAGAPDDRLDALLHVERGAQVRHVRDRCPHLAAILAFHARLMRLDPRQERALEAAGKLCRPDLGPAGALARLGHAPGSGATPAGFDASLGREYEALIAARLS